MIFYLDENIPNSAKAVLEDRGHQCVDHRGSGEEGMSDVSLIQKASSMQAVVLTTDRDFYHTLRHQFPEHWGIIVIALKQPSRNAILAKLNWFLDRFDGLEMKGRSFQLRDVSWLCHPPLEDFNPPLRNIN